MAIAYWSAANEMNEIFLEMGDFFENESILEMGDILKRGDFLKMRDFEKLWHE